MMTQNGLNDTHGSPSDKTIMCEKLLPNAVCYIVAVVSALVVVENILLIATVWRGSTSSLSASSYVFLASLGAADALVGIAGSIMSVTYLKVYPRDDQTYPSSPFFSVVCIVAQTLMLISVIHMAVLALDRYFYILRPFVYMRHVTRRVIMAVVAGCWLLGILTMALPSLYYIYHSWEPFCEAIDTNSVFTLSICSAYLIVFMLTCFAYVKIFQVVRRQNRSIAVLQIPPDKVEEVPNIRASRNLHFLQREPSTSTSSKDQPIESDSHHTGTPLSSEKQYSWRATMKIVKFLFLVFGIFVMFTLPATLLFALNSRVTLNREAAFYVISLWPTNCAGNFLIVVIRDKSFRKELISLLRDTASYLTRKP